MWFHESHSSTRLIQRRATIWNVSPTRYHLLVALNQFKVCSTFTISTAFNIRKKKENFSIFIHEFILFTGECIRHTPFVPSIICRIQVLLSISIFLRKIHSHFLCFLFFSLFLESVFHLASSPLFLATIVDYYFHIPWNRHSHLFKYSDIDECGK